MRDERACVRNRDRTYSAQTVHARDSVFLTNAPNRPIDTAARQTVRAYDRDGTCIGERATRPKPSDGHEQTDSVATRTEPGGETRGALRSRWRRGRIAVAAVTSGERRNGGGRERGALVRFRRASTARLLVPSGSPCQPRALACARYMRPGCAALCSVSRSLCAISDRDSVLSASDAHTCARTYAGDRVQVCTRTRTTVFARDEAHGATHPPAHYTHIRVETRAR